MAVNRAALGAALLLPGLADIEGEYQRLPAVWPKIFDRANTKMAVERWAEVRKVGLAQLKNEGAATVFDNAAGLRFVYNVVINTIGLGFAMTQESIEDNVYKDQFGPESMGLLESFLQTKEIVLHSVLNTAGTANPQAGGDGLSLLNTAHVIDNGTFANTPQVALDFNESSLEFALNNIMFYPDQAGLIANTTGRKLVAPVALQWQVKRLFGTQHRVGTANNDINALVADDALPEGYVISPFLTSNFSWFVLTNVKGLVCVERTPFEMDLQVDPTTGNLLVIGRERYGGGFKNYRALYGSMPTA